MKLCMRLNSAVRFSSAAPICRPSSFLPASMFQITVSLSKPRCRSSSSPYASSNCQARSVMKTSFASARSGVASSSAQPSAAKVGRCDSSTAATRASTGSPPRSALQAMRTPLKSRASGRAYRLPGSAIAIGLRASRPAITLNISAQSSTVRAIGPCTPSVLQPVFAGQIGTRPGEVRRPTMLQKLAGQRSEPPMSLPSARGTMPAASATAAPPEEPPQVLPVS